MIRFVLCGSLASAAVLAVIGLLVAAAKANLGSGPMGFWPALGLMAAVAIGVFVLIPAVWWGVYLSSERGWNAIGKRLSPRNRRGRGWPPLG